MSGGQTFLSFVLGTSVAALAADSSICGLGACARRLMSVGNMVGCAICLSCENGGAIEDKTWMELTPRLTMTVIKCQEK